MISILHKLVVLYAVVYVPTVCGYDPRRRGFSPEQNQNQQHGFLTDLEHKPSESQGFVEPIDFSAFASEQNFQVDTNTGSGFDASIFAASESKPVGFSSIFGEERQNSTGFVEPVQFPSQFQSQESEVPFRPRAYVKTTPKLIKPPASETTRQKTNPGPHYNRSPPPASAQQQRPYAIGKSSYPGFRPHHQQETGSKADESAYQPHHYPPRDVEVFLPPGKALLPTQNGKPKPYDGYRAAPIEQDDLNLFNASDKRKRKVQRQSHVPSIHDPRGGYAESNGQVTFNPSQYKRVKKQPAEYVGGIYPYYDFSDPKNARNLKTAQSNTQKQTPVQREKITYPREDSKRKSKKVAADSSREATEDDGATEEEEFQGEIENVKGGYEEDPITVERLNIHVPKLRVKTYPYEDYKDTEEYEPPGPVAHATFKGETSDIEQDFGIPDFTKEVAEQSEKQEQLRKNKNCRQLTKRVSPGDISSGRAKRDAQVCFVCTDPKTGGSFEQCSYKTDPKANQYFVGSSTSFSSKAPPKSLSYRYKRDLYSYDPFKALEDYSFTYDDFVNLDGRLNRKARAPKQPHKYHHLHNPYYDREHDLHTKSSEHVGQKKKPKYYDPAATGTEHNEAPPPSYNGPEETYEGPDETYEGPEESYEGPEEPYEGPQYAHGELVDGKYYDAREDSAATNYDKLLKTAQDSASTIKNTYNNKPQQFTNQPVKQYRVKSYKKAPLEVEYGSKHSPSYDLSDLAGYRFGPEHFKVEEEEKKDKENQKEEQVEESKTVDAEEKETAESAEKPKEVAPTENKAKTEKKNIVKFANGDVCEKIKKDGMICMICLNDKSGASYEQCQYASKPGDKYYSYGTQKSYKHAPPPSETPDQEPEKSDTIEKKVYISKKKEKAERKVFGDDDAPAPEELLLAESKSFASYVDDMAGAFSEQVEQTVAAPVKSDEVKEPTENTEVKQLTVERIEPRDGVEGLDEFLRSKSPYEERKQKEDDAEEDEEEEVEEEGKKKEAIQGQGSEDKQAFKSYEEYFHDLFPEFEKEGKLTPYSNEEIDNKSIEKFSDADDAPSEGEQQNEEADEAEDTIPKEYYDTRRDEEEPEESKRLKDKSAGVPDFIYDNDEHKKDLEKALGDFVSKDWTNCKKIIKEKLTCYQCVDKNGVDNEECMYVEASAPVLKHLAYHEKKDFGKKPKKERRSNDTPQPEEDEPKIRTPKNAKPDHIPVTERSEETINNEKYLPKDLVSTATKDEEISENVTERKPMMRKSKMKSRKQKWIRTNKTNENQREETTEVATDSTTPEYIQPTTYRARKIRKYPIKKFIPKENVDGVTETSNIEKPQIEEERIQ